MLCGHLGVLLPLGGLRQQLVRLGHSLFRTERTQRLLDRGLRLLTLSLPLVRARILRRPLRELLDLIAEVRA